MHAVKLMGLTFLVFFLTACSNMGDLKSYMKTVAPAVKITGTQIEKLALDQIDLNVNLEIDNPNSIAIDVSGFSYEVFVNNKLFTKGTESQRNRINASSKSQTSFPVTLVFAELQKVLKDVKNLNEIDYEIKTVITINLPVVGNVSVDAADSGTLPIPKAPKISVSEVKLGKVNFKTAEVMVTLDVKNPNIFDVDIANLNYQLSVAGKQWATSSIKQSIALKKQANNKINIPIKLNVWDIGGSVIKSLGGGKSMDYNVKGDMVLNTGLPLFNNVKLPFDYSAKLN